jgi:hypothetical protein
MKWLLLIAIAAASLARGQTKEPDAISRSAVSQAELSMLRNTVERLSKENADLRRRLAAMEDRLKEAGASLTVEAPASQLKPATATSLQYLIKSIPAHYYAKASSAETEFDKSERQRWINANLTGRTVTLLGALGELRPAEAGTYRITLMGSDPQSDPPYAFGVSATCTDRARNLLSQLTKGQKIIVTGNILSINVERQKGVNMMEVNLTLGDCELRQSVLGAGR